MEEYLNAPDRTISFFTKNGYEASFPLGDMDEIDVTEAESFLEDRGYTTKRIKALKKVYCPDILFLDFGGDMFEEGLPLLNGIEEMYIRSFCSTDPHHENFICLNRQNLKVFKVNEELNFDGDVSNVLDLFENPNMQSLEIPNVKYRRISLDVSVYYRFKEYIDSFAIEHLELAY